MFNIRGEATDTTGGGTNQYNFLGGRFGPRFQSHKHTPLGSAIPILGIYSRYSFNKYFLPPTTCQALETDAERKTVPALRGLPFS